MRVHVTKPTIIYADNLSAIINTKEPGSTLKQNHVALSYHFYRKHYSSGVVDIRKVDGNIITQILSLKDLYRRNSMDIWETIEELI